MAYDENVPMEREPNLRTQARQTSTRLEELEKRFQDAIERIRELERIIGCERPEAKGY